MVERASVGLEEGWGWAHEDAAGFFVESVGCGEEELNVWRPGVGRHGFESLGVVEGAIVAVGWVGGEWLEELVVAVLVPLLEHEAERLLVKEFRIEGVGCVGVRAKCHVEV